MLKEIKRVLLNKRIFISIISLSLLFLCSFLIIKDKYYYELVNYISEYLDYYSNTYLTDISDLISDNKIWLFVEYDVVNIYSSIFIYFVSQNNFIYTIISLIVPIFIFYFINSYIFTELQSNFFKIIIKKTSFNSYQYTRIICSMLIGGLISLLPKLFYLLILQIFFVNGYSTTHYLNNAAFIPTKYLFIQPGFTPSTLLCAELITSFIYGMIISLISIIVISISNRKVISYLLSIFIIYGQAALASVFSNVIGKNILTPFIDMYSLLNFLSYNSQNANITFIIAQYSFLIVLLFIIANKLFKKRVKDQL